MESNEAKMLSAISKIKAATFVLTEQKDHQMAEEKKESITLTHTGADLEKPLPQDSQEQVASGGDPALEESCTLPRTARSRLKGSATLSTWVFGYLRISHGPNILKASAV